MNRLLIFRNTNIKLSGLMALDTLKKDNILVNRGVYESKMTIQNFGG